MPKKYYRLIGGNRLYLVTSFIPGHGCQSSAAPRNLDRLVSGYRLTQTSLLHIPDMYGERHGTTELHHFFFLSAPKTDFE